MDYTQEQIEKWFTHAEHSPAQGAALTKLHDAARATALLIFTTLPDGAEKKLALDNLQQAVMWANTAISRHGA